MYFYNARYYDASLGRFVQADTIVPGPGNPQDFNRYSYVRNNPLKYIDPSGHRECGPACPYDSTTWEINFGSAYYGDWGRGWTARDTKVVAWTAVSLFGVAALPEIIGAVPEVVEVAKWKPVEWILRHPRLARWLGWGATAATAAGGDPSDELTRFLEGREAYESQVRVLGEEGERMLAEGQPMEQVATWAHEARRALGEAFKARTPPKLLEYIYARNIEKYGDPLGPSIEWLRIVAGKTWEEIFESATRPGGEDIIPLLRKLLEE